MWIFTVNMGRKIGLHTKKCVVVNLSFCDATDFIATNENALCIENKNPTVKRSFCSNNNFQPSTQRWNDVY